MALPSFLKVYAHAPNVRQVIRSLHVSNPVFYSYEDARYDATATAP